MDIDANPALCVVLHDVAPATWPACQRVLEAVRAVGEIPLTLLLVPRYRGTFPHASFERQMTQQLADGHELALHGYTHVDEMPVHGPVEWLRRRFYTAGEGEFSALTAQQALKRLNAGRQWFAAHGWPLHGFVAPAWLLSPGSWHVLNHSPFLYTSTLAHIHALPGTHRHGVRSMRCQSQVYSTRSAWRRVVSAGWNEALAWSQEEAPLVRLELHPWDADHPLVRHSWQALLRYWLETRDAMTTVDFVRTWQSHHRQAASRVSGGQNG
jgi:uncharacterized protein